MFGKKQIQELQTQLQNTQDQLNQTTQEKDSLKQQLEAANARIEALEAQLNDFDLEQAKEDARTAQAEYEGLRDLYKQKNQEFDDTREEKEQTFARDQAIQRHNLENEIRDNRQANQDYVASSVRTFGETYNHYLNQIKLLMDALSNVAAQTGETLFSAENGDFKSRFDSQMRSSLKSGVDLLEVETEEVTDEEPPVPTMQK